MEQQYWIGRMEASQANARAAAGGEAKLIHYDLAGRHSVMAGRGAPFMLPRKSPATEGERDALRLPARPRLLPGGASPPPALGRGRK